MAIKNSRIVFSFMINFQVSANDQLITKMTELRQRDVGDRAQNEMKETAFEDIDKEEAPRIPATSDGIENNPVLQNIPKKYRNYWIRFVVTWILIFSFAVVVYGGAIPLSILILAVQLICFNEIITIGYKVYKTYNLPWFRTLSWYFLFVYNYYLHGDFLADFFRYYLMKRVRTILLVSLVPKVPIVQFYLFHWYPRYPFISRYPSRKFIHISDGILE